MTMRTHALRFSSGLLSFELTAPVDGQEYDALAALTSSTLWGLVPQINDIPADEEGVFGGMVELSWGEFDNLVSVKLSATMHQAVSRPALLRALSHGLANLHVLAAMVDMFHEAAALAADEALMDELREARRFDPRFGPQRTFLGQPVTVLSMTIDLDNPPDTAPAGFPQDMWDAIKRHVTNDDSLRAMFRRAAANAKRPAGGESTPASRRAGDDGRAPRGSNGIHDEGTPPGTGPDAVTQPDSNPEPGATVDMTHDPTVMTEVEAVIAYATQGQPAEGTTTASQQA